MKILMVLTSHDNSAIRAANRLLARRVCRPLFTFSTPERP